MEARSNGLWRRDRGVTCPAWIGCTGVAPPGDANGKHAVAGIRIPRGKGEGKTPHDCEEWARLHRSFNN